MYGRPLAIAACVLIALAVTVPVASGSRVAARCGVKQPSPPPAALTEPPPPSVLDQFAVLRRAAAPADQPPTIVLGDLDGVLDTYNAGYVRQLTPPGATQPVYLVPGYLNQDPCNGPVQFERVQISQLLGPGHASATTPVFCLVQITFGASAFSCQLFASIDAGATTSLLGPPGASTTSAVGGLVPDGVSAVQIGYPVNPTVTTPATNNFFIGGAPPEPPALLKLSAKILAVAKRKHHGKLTAADLRRLERIGSQIDTDTTPSRLQWLGASGQVLRSLTPSPLYGPLIAGGSFPLIRPAH